MPHWTELSKAEQQLARVMYRLEKTMSCRMRKTNRGVPSLVVEEFYSVVYFGKGKSFKVFYEFMNFDEKQNKLDFKLFSEVTDFLLKSVLHNRVK